MHRNGPLLLDVVIRASGRVGHGSSFAGGGRRRKISTIGGRIKNNEPPLISGGHHVRSPKNSVIVGRADFHDFRPYNFKKDWHNCRYFGSDTKDGKQSPDNLTSARQTTEPIDPSTKIKTKMRFSKEYIDALKSEVEEMESSSPSSSNLTNTLRTPDDFADYLKDSQPPIPGSAPVSIPDDKDSNSPNKGDSNSSKKLATDILGTVPVYQYKFKTSDALVSILLRTTALYKLLRFSVTQSCILFSSLTHII
jgi:hypothetical protein